MKEPNTRVLFALLVGIAGLLLYFTLTNGHNWGDDFSAYIMQAQSLTEGTPRGFIEANRFTEQQSSWLMGPVAYPWGFPALLAPFYAVFGLNIIALKSVGVVSFLLFLLLLWVGFQKYHPHFWLLCLVCLFSLNPSLVAFSDNILSDIPFLLFSTFSVMLMGRLIVERRRLTCRASENILLGASIAGAFFIRTNGIMLLVTLGITQLIVLTQSLWRRGQEDLTNNRCPISLRGLLSPSSVPMRGLCVNLIPYASFFCAALAWEMILPEGGSSYYTSHMWSISLLLLKQNLSYYLNLPAEFLAGVPLHYLLYAISIPFAIAGVIRRYRADYHMIVYVLLTFLLCILWPYRQGLRFLFPVLPFYCSFVLTGMEEFQGGTNTVERAFRKMVCLLPILLILSSFWICSISGAYENLIHNRETSSGPFTATSKSMFSFIEQNTESESIVVFFKPRVMRMMTGRRSLMIDKIEELSRGDYLCLYLKGGTYCQVSPDAIIDFSEQGAARLIYENSEFRLYRLMEGLKEPHNTCTRRGIPLRFIPTGEGNVNRGFNPSPRNGAFKLLANKIDSDKIPSDGTVFLSSFHFSYKLRHACHPALSAPTNPCNLVSLFLPQWGVHGGHR